MSPDRTVASSQKEPDLTEIAGQTVDSAGHLVSVSDLLPPNLFLLPVSQTTLFPGMIVPLILPEGKLTQTLEHVLETSSHLGVILSRNPDNPAVAVGPTNSMTGLPA